MRLKTILLTTVATGTLMCEPVMAYAVDSTPDSMGWFRKKKKSEPNDSVKSKNKYEKLTGDGSIIHRGMFNVYQRIMGIPHRFPALQVIHRPDEFYLFFHHGLCPFQLRGTTR